MAHDKFIHLIQFSPHVDPKVFARLKSDEDQIVRQPSAGEGEVLQDFPSVVIEGYILVTRRKPE